MLEDGLLAVAAGAPPGRRPAGLGVACAHDGDARAGAGRGGGGAWRAAAGGRLFPVEDPATGEVLAEVADAAPADAVDALTAAVAAQPAWRSYPPRRRGEILHRAWEALTTRVDELALLMTLPAGQGSGQPAAR